MVSQVCRRSLQYDNIRGASDRNPTLNHHNKNMTEDTISHKAAIAHSDGIPVSPRFMTARFRELESRDADTISTDSDWKGDSTRGTQCTVATASTSEIQL